MFVRVMQAFGRVSSVCSRLKFVIIAVALVEIRPEDAPTSSSPAAVCQPDEGKQCGNSMDTVVRDALDVWSNLMLPDEPVARDPGPDDPRLAYVAYRDHFGDRIRLGFARLGDADEEAPYHGLFSTVVMMNHGEAAQVWLAAVRAGACPAEGVAVLHVDKHSDMEAPDGDGRGGHATEQTCHWRRPTDTPGGKG